MPCGLCLRGKSQPEDGSRPLTSDIHAPKVDRIGEVQGFAMLAPVDFGRVSPGAADVATLLLNDVVEVKPALEVSSAQFVFGVLFITGTLAGLFELDLVIGKLLGSFAASRRYSGCRQ